jgi:hypothetical protein
MLPKSGATCCLHILPWTWRHQFTQNAQVLVCRQTTESHPKNCNLNSLEIETQRTTALLAVLCESMSWDCIVSSATGWILHFLPSFHTGSGVHPAYYSMNTVCSISRGKWPGPEAIPRLPYTPSCHAQGEHDLYFTSYVRQNLVFPAKDIVVFQHLTPFSLIVGCQCTQEHALFQTLVPESNTAS